MLDDYVDTAIVELLRYPANRWGAVPSSRWLSLCADLCDYQPPSPTLTIDSERKWELVSALQKSIRRADTQLALRLIFPMIMCILVICRKLSLLLELLIRGWFFQILV
jgi:hypothetical protein